MFLRRVFWIFYISHLISFTHDNFLHFPFQSLKFNVLFLVKVTLTSGAWKLYYQASLSIVFFSKCFVKIVNECWILVVSYWFSQHLSSLVYVSCYIYPFLDLKSCLTSLRFYVLFIHRPGILQLRILLWIEKM